ncbi:MAG: NAD-dependent epimerase/dehydratase family protein [Nitriliruptoraceae bacterium]|nr:NAD-dependent epimerase/dehydratase family protein [Nitriliruptoraceae bacterium]
MRPRRRVLVTGASGSYGRAVTHALLARGDQVVTLQRRPSGIASVTEVLGDITDPATLARAVDGCDGVIHLAARVGIVGSEADFLVPNVTGTRLLLEAARAAAVPCVVFVSSPSVAHAGTALVGVGATPATPEQVRGHYARTKALAERDALAADADGFAVVAIRPHLVWGPGDTQLIGRIIARARSGRLALVDDGAALIDTTYRDDAATATVAALDRAEVAHGRALVVSGGEPRPVAEIVARVCAAAGVPMTRRHVPFRLAHTAGRVLEAGFARLAPEAEPPLTAFLAEQLATAHWFAQAETRDVLDWAPHVGIDEGFRRLEAALRG